MGGGVKIAKNIGRKLRERESAKTRRNTAKHKNDLNHEVTKTRKIKGIFFVSSCLRGKSFRGFLRAIALSLSLHAFTGSKRNCTSWVAK
jgi:hypothetical protein